MRIFGGSKDRGVVKSSTSVLFTIADQGLQSFSAFLVSYLLLRWLGTSAYGVYAVSNVALLVAMSLMNSLLLEPVSVSGEQIDSVRFATLLKTSIWIHVSLALVFAVSVYIVSLAISSGEVSSTLKHVAWTLPVILLPTTIRRHFYLIGQPALAAVTSFTVLLSTGCFLLAVQSLKGLTPASAFQLIALSSFVSSVAGLRLMPVSGTNLIRPSGARATWASFVILWRIGRWAAFNTAFSAAASQATIILSMVLLDSSTAGEVRALALPIQPLYQSMIAVGGFLVLPVVARIYSSGQHCEFFRRSHEMSKWMTFGAVVYLVLLILLRDKIVRILGLDPSRVEAWLVPMMGLVPLLAAMSAGATVGLRAAQVLVFYPVSAVVPACIALVSALPLIHFFGLPGAVLSTVLAGVSAAAIATAMFRNLRFSCLDREFSKCA